MIGLRRVRGTAPRTLGLTVKTIIGLIAYVSGQTAAERWDTHQLADLDYLASTP